MGFPCTGTSAIASLMNFPMDWFSPMSLTKPQDELELDISQEEVSHQDKPRSHSLESSISIPCLIKQPNQAELKGVIKEDLDDRFLVYILSDDSTVTVSKLFVYPDFSKSVPQGYNIGQIGKKPSKNLSPSKNR